MRARPSSGAALLALLLFCASLSLLGGGPLGGGALPARAQQTPPAGVRSSGAQGDSTDARPPLVTAVRFAGNETFERDVLARRVRTAPNRRLLGLPGLTWWRWLYGLGDAVGGGVGGALKRMGEAPALLDRAALSSDAERLAAFYRQEGFRQAEIEAEVEPTGRRGEVAVVFRIRPGPALYARRARYTGLGALPPAERERLVRQSLLHPEGAPVRSRAGGDTLRFRARGQRYSEGRFLRERSRLLGALHDGGYARATRDSIRALIFPQRPDSFDVTFRVRPGPRYRVGDLRVQVEGPEEGAAPRVDTLRLSGGPGQVTVRAEGESELSPRLLERALRGLRPGQWYSQSDLLAAKRRLEATGVFSFTDITALEPRRPDSTGAAPVLPHRIVLRTRPRHRARLETFALQRSGFISNEVGFGLGATYENGNFFSEGETFRMRVAGSVASDFDTGESAEELLFSSAQLEGSASLTYPYLVGPFARLEGLYGSFYDARTQLSLSLLTARRENLGFIIRGRGEARLRLEMRHTSTLTSLVDVVDLSLSNPDTLAGFEETFLERVIGSAGDPIVRDPVQRARVLEDYTAPQIGSALRYTLRAATVNPLARREGYSYETAAEVGGLLPALLDRFVLTPDTVESSLPGLPFLRGAGAANRLRYRPYARLVADARRYRPLGASMVLAGKLIAGLAHPIGKPGLVPFDRRFYAGGASSVRGWGLRELRPAAPEALVGDTLSGDALAGDAPNLLGGDIKLEAAVELRQTLLRDVLGSTDWGLALFADAGNAWIGPRNPGPDALRFRLGDFLGQVGVGSGLGLRLDWDFLLLRLDAAFKVHDPLQRGNPFPDGLSRPRLHFGIGHAF